MQSGIQALPVLQLWNFNAFSTRKYFSQVAHLYLYSTSDWREQTYTLLTYTGTQRTTDSVQRRTLKVPLIFTQCVCRIGLLLIYGIIIIDIIDRENRQETKRVAYLIFAVLVGDMLFQTLLATKHLLTFITFEQFVTWFRFQVLGGQRNWTSKFPLLCLAISILYKVGPQRHISEPAILWHRTLTPLVCERW